MGMDMFLLATDMDMLLPATDPAMGNNKFAKHPGPFSPFKIGGGGGAFKA